FARPSALSLRKARNQAGPKLFSREELLSILKLLQGKPVEVEGGGKPIERAADPQLKAMLLLGLNCGFGNTDVASLPQSAVDLVSGWVEFPRPKTGIRRRVPLWPETVAAIRGAIDNRPSPKSRSDAGLCFLTIQGNPWVRTRLKQSSDSDDEFVTVNTLQQRFSGVLKMLGINGRRGLGFYTLRHVFETIGGESRDQVAVDAIMGHVDSSMAGNYRQGISDERLQDVVNKVRGWLFGEGGAA
ncbi:MAG: tyrosine-type recombinase/integrase, partial [Planctomycetaceae bacterium]|nr:tyrosine-type recombinase/integrase [Planctomycetaceae bacterium]